MTASTDTGADTNAAADTKLCPYCAETIKRAAIKCRYCGSLLENRAVAAEWRRELDGKMVAGVCSGLARQFGVPMTALRITFVIATFIGGWGLLIYAALWIIMPVAERSDVPALPHEDDEPPPPPKPSDDPETPETSPDAEDSAT